MKKINMFICLILTVFMSSCQSNSNSDSIKLSPKIFNDSLMSNDAQLVDVRTPEEFQLDHINNALNINFYSNKFTDSISLLNTDKSVYIYCRSGKRSSNSVSLFKKAGFKHVYELDGGFLNWKAEIPN